MSRPRLWLAASLLVALVALPGCSSALDFGEPTAPGEVSLAEIHQDLTPYGAWLDSPTFGTVFKPNATADFVPYESNGRWVYADEGWEFESDDPWGAITYHYGRWFKDQELGWVWAPDTIWGPSWVEWREGGSYVGWYVMPPLGWSYDAYGWVWVRTGDFARPHLPAHVIRGDEVRQAWIAAQPVRRGAGRFGGQWSIGPPPRHVEAALGRPVPRPRMLAGRLGEHGRSGGIGRGGHAAPARR